MKRPPDRKLLLAAALLIVAASAVLARSAEPRVAHFAATAALGAR